MKHMRVGDTLGLIAAAFLILLLAMAFNGCSTERKGCQLTKGYVGY